MSKTIASVSVVIVNWNQKDLTLKCIRLLGDQTIQPKQVIVVDNGSTDQSAEALEKLKSIELVKLPTNQGFAGGMNAGFQKVRSQLILLLNNDCILAPNWIEKAVRLMGKNECIIGGIEFQYKSEDNLYKTNLPYKAAPLINPTTGITYETHRAGKLQHVPYTTASNVIIPLSVVNELQGFDESFFAYYEDVDLCARAFAKNKQTYVSSELKAWHASGTTASTIPYKISFLKTRNRFFFLYKQASRQVVESLPKLLNKELLRSTMKIATYPLYALARNDHQKFVELRGQWKGYTWLATNQRTLKQLRAKNKDSGTYSQKYWQLVSNDYEKRSHESTI